MKDQIKYYKRKYPLVDEMVMIRIDNIGEACVNVTLMEYDIEGIIVFKELWAKRLRKKNLRQAAPIGKCMPAQVMATEGNREGVDKLISLTKKRLTPDEISEFSKLFTKNKQVISLIENLSHITETNFEVLIEKIIHELNHRFIEIEESDYESILDIFEEAEKNDDYNFLEDLDLSDVVKENLIGLIKKKFKPINEKVSVKLALLSNSNEGINMIKRVLIASENENQDFSYYLDKTPYYNIEINTDEPRLYKKKLDQIVNNIQTEILSNKGQFKLVEKSY